jgi:hypothetical protein
VRSPGVAQPHNEDLRLRIGCERPMSFYFFWSLFYDLNIGTAAMNFLQVLFYQLSPKVNFAKTFFVPTHAPGVCGSSCHQL